MIIILRYILINNEAKELLMLNNIEGKGDVDFEILDGETDNTMR